MSNSAPIKEFQCLQDGSRYCKYFRLNMCCTLFLGIMALALLIICLVLMFTPKHPVYYVSSTQGTVAKLNPVSLQTLAQIQTKGGNESKSLPVNNEQ